MTDDKVERESRAQKVTEEKVDRESRAQRMTDEKVDRESRVQRMTDEKVDRESRAQKSIGDKGDRESRAQRITDEKVERESRVQKSMRDKEDRESRAQRMTDEKPERESRVLMMKDELAETSQTQYSSSLGQSTTPTLQTTTIDTTNDIISSTELREPSSSFMNKRRAYIVVDQGVDVTPDNIVDPRYITMSDRFYHVAFETRKRFRSENQLRDAKSKSVTTEVGAGGGVKMYATTINLDDIHIDHTLNTEEGLIDADAIVEEAPSAYYLPKDREAMTYPPSIFVILKETETAYLYELPSSSYEKGTADGTAIEQENELYSFLTVGKGRNRKTIHRETQTNPKINQTRHSLATRPKKKNASAFASVWDMYDTYAKLEKAEKKEEFDEMVLYQSADARYLRKKKASDLGKEEVTFEKLISTQAFQDAVMLAERVLAAKEFVTQQKTFRGLVQKDLLALDLKYIYSLKPLWTLESTETAGRPITCIHFNPKNENILAVGYGKFVYADYFDGLICIWNTKNPCKPERQYRFESAVTSICFSSKHPSWLGCGFFNGAVLVLDITSYDKKLISESKRETNPCFEPIWQCSWEPNETRDSEFVFTTCQDGRVNRFTSTKTNDFICSLMMRVTTVEGKMLGLELPHKCIKVDVPITRYPAALCYSWHPRNKSQYFIGTDEGYIHKCSVHYINQYVDVYRAHAGPVYEIVNSPFMDNIIVSCGADNAIRWWMDGVDEVIMTLVCPSAVYGIALCPVNATLLLSVSGNVLSVWDVRRKTHIPCAEYTFPHNVVLTKVKFSSNGENIFVTDSQGIVYTYHLEDTPIAPYYQRKILDDAIKRALCTRPHLLKNIKKLERYRDLNQVMQEG